MIPDRDPALPDLSSVREARRRLAGQIRNTPLEVAPGVARAAGSEVLLKLENLQRTGSFKLRGALSAVSSLTAREAARGVVTASAGNHGLGVALAGRLTGVSATVFVPRGAPETKRERIASQGAELRLVDGGYDEAHAAALAHAGMSGSVYIHAFSDPEVVAGQGTVAMEVLERVLEPEVVVVPVGGGGLIGGVGLVLRALSPGTRIIGVQTPPTSAMHDSLAAGHPVPAPTVPTLCEGLAGDIDERSLRLAREVVDEMILVEEDSVRAAMAHLYRTEGLVVEGSGAVAVAALLEGRIAPVSGSIVAIVTGGNVDLEVLREALRHPGGTGPAGDRVPSDPASGSA